MAGPEPLPTLDLIRGAQSGDPVATEQLFARYLPRLRWWAKGRLPAHARGTIDTEDLVQDALLATLRRVDNLDPRSGGCFQAYTRQAILNALRDRLRRHRPRVDPEVALQQEADPSPSPLEATVGRDELARYERALARLSPAEQELIVARLELHYSWAEVAEITGRGSADAARVATRRALVRIAGEMER